MKNHKILTHYLPFLTWMAIIFLFSNQVADDSNSISLGITQTLYNILQQFNVDSFLSYDTMNHFIRKLAHFTIYFILGVLIIRAFSKPLRISSIIQGLFIGFLYACTDEVHQYFIPGRAMMITDVLIDTMGTLTGIIIFKGISVKYEEGNRDSESMVTKI